MGRSLPSKAILCGTILIVTCAVGGIVYLIGPKLYYMKSEYVTAHVIRAADLYISQHPQEWPKSWQELGLDDYSQYTEFRFDLTPEAILQDQQLIYSAIQPRCRQYRTYPHARRQLDELYRKLASEPRRD
jgi:hypothetical protein